MINPAETDLASRQSAAELRLQIERAVESTGAVTIDLSGVLSMSSGYADEVFGVLAMKDAGRFLFDYVTLDGAKPNVKATIGKAIELRLSP